MTDSIQSKAAPGEQQAITPPATPFDWIADMCRPVNPRASIFPGYIAFKIRDAMELAAQATGDDHVIAPGTIRTESVGDCRYAIHASDFNGAEYRIDVECVKHGDGWVPSRLRPGNTAADRIHKLNRSLAAIQLVAENLAALTPGKNTTALLIASLAKETLGGAL